MEKDNDKTRSYSGDQMADFSVLLHELRSDVKEILGVLNGTGDGVGIKGKVDRHERKFQSYDKFMWILATAIIGILVKMIAG